MFENIPILKRWKVIIGIIGFAFAVSLMYAKQVWDLDTQVKTLRQKTKLVEDADMEIINRQVRLKQLSDEIQNSHPERSEGSSTQPDLPSHAERSEASSTQPDLPSHPERSEGSSKQPSNPEQSEGSLPARSATAPPIRSHGDLMHRIEHLTDTLGLQLIQLPQQNIEQVESYQIAQVDFSVKGDFQNIVAFIYQIEVTDRLGTISKADLELKTLRKDSGTQDLLVATIRLTRLVSQPQKTTQ